MDQTDILPLLDDLSTDIDALSRALTPLLDTPLPTISSKLPLLDKAKLHILTTYAIESLLFSSLRLSGADAKEHPVFTELTRTRQYFDKVKKAEEGPQQRTLTVDKGAAGRIIKAGLAGNDRIEGNGKRKRDEQMDETGDERHGDTETPNTPSLSEGGSAKKKRNSKSRSQWQRDKSSKPPKSGREAFQSLMKGPKEQR